MCICLEVSGRDQFRVHYPGVFLEKVRKTTKTHSIFSVLADIRTGNSKILLPEPTLSVEKYYYQGRTITTKQNALFSYFQVEQSTQ